MTQYSFEIRSDLAVIGYNPEAADLDHPRGEVIGERYYMVATDPDGATRVWGWHTSAEALEAGFEFIAPDVEDWDEGRPRYGSLAFQESDQDGEDAFFERRAYEIPAFAPGPFERVY